MSKYFKFDKLYVDAVGKTYCFNLKKHFESNRKSLLNDDVNYSTMFNASFDIYNGLNRFKFYSVYDNFVVPFTINFDKSYQANSFRKCILKNVILIKKHYFSYLVKHYILKILSFPFK